MKAIKGFPHIRPEHWRPILCKHYKKKSILREDPLYLPAHMFCQNAKRKQALMAERQRKAFVRKVTTKPKVDPQPPLEDRVAQQEWSTQMAEFDLWRLRKKHGTLVEDEEILESETSIAVARKVKFIESQRLEWVRDMMAKKVEVEELKEQVLALRAELGEAREEN